MAKSAKQLRRQMGPRSIRVRDTTAQFDSVHDMIMWQKFCAESAAATNPKGAIRSFRTQKTSRRRKKCCNGGNKYYGR